MMCFFLYISCEKTSLQTTERDSNLNSKISPRNTIECEDCLEVEDCCCGIDRQVSNASYSLRICGTSNESGSCGPTSPPSPCTTISGGGASFPLNSTNPKYGFCMVPGTSFYIQNLLNAPAFIYVTCQEDVTFPQRIAVTVPALGFAYVNADGSCEVGECTE